MKCIPNKKYTFNIKMKHYKVQLELHRKKKPKLNVSWKTIS